MNRMVGFLVPNPGKGTVDLIMVMWCANDDRMCDRKKATQDNRRKQHGQTRVGCRKPGLVGLCLGTEEFHTGALSKMSTKFRFGKVSDSILS